MMNIWCFLGFHKWSKWSFVREEITKTGFKQDVLHTECKRCGKNDHYIGICDEDIITDKKTPYTIKGD